MNEIKLIINDIPLVGSPGQTILDIAVAGGIDIPTFCYDERVEISGSCGICVVEVEGNPRLLRACATIATDGMVVHTETERIQKNRKTALELLLSDHAGDCIAPCVLACPAHTDCQGYVGLIAKGEYKAAYELIREKLPFPASIGRVCPHPCEEACRRELVEEPIAIMSLKQFVGDLALATDGFAANPEVTEETNKSVAVIGGGPGGLSVAYFLRLKGHAVTVYDAMPHMGGMLRYGIPEYRLPKALLQKEIDLIEQTGITFLNNVRVGSDVSLDELRRRYNAIVVAAGAWTSTGLRCPGEEMDGVLGGINFLRDVADNGNVADNNDVVDSDDVADNNGVVDNNDAADNEIATRIAGQIVAVVGGGNTAMDACRTAIRLGADKVYNIYRRTRAEMPAEEIEIREAEEEGVIFKNLTNPLEIIAGDNGKVSKVRLQIMELGEPDASGRRAPVTVEGKEETLDVDVVIAAIGQKLDAKGLETLELTRWGTIIADEQTFRTNLDGVFAIGDATNDGADIAITAMGEAQRAAEMIERYLNGEELTYRSPYLVKDEKTAEDFTERTREPRAKMPHRSPDERRGDFAEINFGFSESEAKREAARCLACGCLDYPECKLITYANNYEVHPEKYGCKVHRRAEADDIPGVRRTPDKCILCGLCVRLCEESVGAGVLGFVNRGIETVVQPAGNTQACESCSAKCAEACPTGALLVRE